MQDGFVLSKTNLTDDRSANIYWRIVLFANKNG